MRSEIEKDGRFLLFGFFGEYRYDGREGTQDVVQMGSELIVEIFIQEPEIRYCLHF
jgi:hypothetical protein